MRNPTVCFVLIACSECAANAQAPGQPPSSDAAPASVPTPAQPKPVDPKDALAATIQGGIEVLLKLQESYANDVGDGVRAEWPYEGVYKVQNKTPIGYRVGGTAIAVEALVKAPGYAEDTERKGAVARGVRFICDAREHPLMSEKDYDAGYDTRGWGYIYGLRSLCILTRLDLVPPELKEPVKATMEEYLDRLQKTEIPEVGGWNYARPPGREKVAPPSSFMTPAGLCALYEAKGVGLSVDEQVVSRALDAIGQGRGIQGNVAYSIDPKGRGAAGASDRTPGAIGRMCATESALLLGGRGSVERVRGAVDAFIVNWKWLELRRSKTGTHSGPYMVAPYYFMFAHFHVAMAIELLPANERGEYRARVNELLLSVQGKDNGHGGGVEHGWNDRHFARSAGYGTAMALLALGMPDAPPPTPWIVPKKE